MDSKVVYVFDIQRKVLHKKVVLHISTLKKLISKIDLAKKDPKKISGILSNHSGFDVSVTFQFISGI